MLSASLSDDIYSLGIIIWEVMTGEVPYGDCTSIREVRNRVSSANIRPLITPNINEEIGELLIRCWDYDPEERPSATYVLTTLRASLVEESESLVD